MSSTVKSKKEEVMEEYNIENNEVNAPQSFFNNVYSVYHDTNIVIYEIYFILSFFLMVFVSG
jgi:hypothetical protein